MTTQANLSSRTFIAGADLRTAQFLAVKMNSVGECVLCSVAGEALVGVLQNKPDTGQAATVAVGGRTKWIANGAINPGVGIATANNGKAGLSAGYIAGYSVESAVSQANQVIEVELQTVGADVITMAAGTATEAESAERAERAERVRKMSIEERVEFERQEYQRLRQEREDRNDVVANMTPEEVTEYDQHFKREWLEREERMHSLTPAQRDTFEAILRQENKAEAERYSKLTKEQRQAERDQRIREHHERLEKREREATERRERHEQEVNERRERHEREAVERVEQRRQQAAERAGRLERTDQEPANPNR